MLKPPLDTPTRLKLSIMMFLEFAIWGAWFVVFYDYLIHFNFTSTQAGTLIGNVALGAIISTMFAGTIADRLLSSEYLMAICHLGGGVLLYFISTVHDPNDFNLLFALTLGYSLLYNPTLILVNSITFRHVPDGGRDFPTVRVLGTIGWIAAGFAIDWLFAGDKTPSSHSVGPLQLAAGLSIALGLYSLIFIPKTPPLTRASEEASLTLRPGESNVAGIPFIKALALFKDFSFAVFFTVSLFITVVLAFYFTVMSNFLTTQVGIQNVGQTMAIGQICEILFMLLLPLFLWRFGMKWVLAIGMLCWGIRYLLFSQGAPSGAGFWMVMVGIGLHGLCFDFFFAAGFIHCNNEAPKEITASAQALFGFLTYGVGMWLGNLLAGRLQKVYTVDEVVDWEAFWQVPAYGVLACLAVFVLFFRGNRPPKSSQAVGLG